MADARNATGEAKLALLDGVAARRGTLFVEASRAARDERLGEVQKLVEADKPADALADINLWWPSMSRVDAEIEGLRARAYDASFGLCADAPCRYLCATRANAATTTADRSARLAGAREGLFTSLVFPEPAGETTLARLQRLRRLIVDAASITQVASNDGALTDKAKTSQAWAQNERDKVALVNSSEAVVAELLGPLTERDAAVATTTVGGISTFLSFDAQRICRGVYVVGAAGNGTRSLDATGEGTARLLSQAVGHAASVRRAVGAGTTSRWMEGWIPVVARWRNGALVELRIGDATP
jgi:hypothetical protein